jgi:2Fe-2S ferredoxin
LVRITFVQQDGTRREVEGHSGSLMELGRGAGVRGIVGECGGACACGTCHVHLSDDGLALLGEATAAEMNMLEFEPGATEASRLSCQIAIDPAIDGLTVTVAGG